MNMERFFKRRRSDLPSSSNVQSSNELVEYQAQEEVKLDLSDIVTDPGLRKPIDEFDVNIRDEVRRECMSRGPCQLTSHVYPKTAFGNHERSFRDVWYKKFPWLEYSVSKDAAFCFWCYLFKPSDKGGRYGVDTFTKLGFSNWKKALEKFNSHVGAANSCHNSARVQFESFRDQGHDIAMLKSSRQEMDAVCSTRLTILLDATRLVLKQGWPFFGQAVLFDPSNRGNFVELLELFCQLNPDLSKAISPSAPEMDQMITPEMQKQFAHACAAEVTSAIRNDIGDKTFTLLVEEARGSLMDDHMGVIVRYVNKEGCAVERFLAMVHVADTSSHPSKSAIDDLFAEHDLSLSKLRFLGYDGASCMRRDFKELKGLILEENPHVIYGHCFSYQLQSLIIGISEGVYGLHDLVSSVSLIVSTIGAPCRMSDQLGQSEHERLVNELKGGERESGDTAWGSHYLTLLRLCSVWSSVDQVLDNIRENAPYADDRCTADRLFDKMGDYRFVFALHVMKHLLGITNELSLILQQKEQNIIQAVSLISTVKYQLQSFKEDGWKIILNQVNSLCELNNLPLIDMEEKIKRPCHRNQFITNFHFYHEEIFCKVVDLITQEMNDRFSEASIEAFSCIACLDLRNSFSKFDVDQLMRFAARHTEDFSANDYLCLPQQLSNFIANMKCDPQFSEVSNLESLSRKMVKTGKNLVFPLVYHLIELALVLPITTPSVERAVSAMKTIETDLLEQLGDECTNDSLVAYIESDIFSTIENGQILQRFQSSEHKKSHQGSTF